AQLADLQVERVHLSPNLGDPLVAPRVLDKIAALRGAGVKRLALTTNGILLDKVGIRNFLAHGADVIGISTSAFNEDMYHRLYRSRHYQRMRSNVLQLLRENRALPREKQRHISINI